VVLDSGGLEGERLFGHLREKGSGPEAKKRRTGMGVEKKERFRREGSVGEGERRLNTGGALSEGGIGMTGKGEQRAGKLQRRSIFIKEMFGGSKTKQNGRIIREKTKT